MVVVVVDPSRDHAAQQDTILKICFTNHVPKAFLTVGKPPKSQELIRPEGSFLVRKLFDHLI